MEKVLEVTNLTKKYKNGRGVFGVNFFVEKGDVLGILGPNGSGKTTIMKSIVGLCQIDSGNVSFFGHNIEENFESAMNKVGCLIEYPALFEHMSAYKNLKLMARFYDNIGTAEIDHILKVVSLDRYKNEKVSNFSLGMKQRLGLAMAMVSSPEVLILDEPSNGLDIEGRIEIREIINRLSKEKGISFLISNHQPEEIEKTCNKVVVVYEGEWGDVCSISEALMHNPTLEDYFLSEIRNKRGTTII